MKKLRFVQREWPTGVLEETVQTIDGWIVKYNPASPKERVTWSRGTRAGAVPVAHQVENVVETFEIVLDVYDGVDFYTDLHAIEGVLSKARAWAESGRADMRMMIQIQDDIRHNNTEWYEARLFGGRVSVRRRTVSIVLVIERSPYWEGAEVPLQMMNTSAGTFTWEWYPTIYNHDDPEPGHDNWVFVKPPEGDTPTPARLRIQNTFDDARRLREVRVGWYDRPGQFVLEAEDAAYSGTLNQDTDWSNNTRVTADDFRWEITQAEAFQGISGFFVVLANGGLSAGNWRIRAGYELTKLITLPWVAGANGWTNLGVIELPPGSFTRLPRYPVRIWLEGAADGALDFVQLVPVPVGAHSVRRLTFIGYNAQNGMCIVDDGINEELFCDFGGQRLPVVEAHGEPIMIWPDTMMPTPEIQPGGGATGLQMLTFTQSNDLGGAEPLRTARLELYVRPRWRTLP